MAEGDQVERRVPQSSSALPLQAGSASFGGVKPGMKSPPADWPAQGPMSSDPPTPPDGVAAISGPPAGWPAIGFSQGTLPVSTTPVPALPEDCPASGTKADVLSPPPPSVSTPPAGVVEIERAGFKQAPAPRSLRGKGQNQTPRRLVASQPPAGWPAIDGGEPVGVSDPGKTEAIYKNPLAAAARFRRECQALFDRPEPTPIPIVVSPPFVDLGLGVATKVAPPSFGPPPLRTIEGVPLPIERQKVCAGARLMGEKLRDADLANACLSGANLSGADLSGADMSRADLSGAQLRGTNLDGAILVDACLEQADLKDASLRHADLRRSSLKEAYLEGAVFDDARVMVVDFRGCHLSWQQILSFRLPPPSRELLNRIWNWDFKNAGLERKHLVQAVRARRYPWADGVKLLLHSWGAPHWNRGRKYVDDSNVVSLRQIIDEVLRFLLVGV